MHPLALFPPVSSPSLSISRTIHHPAWTERQITVPIFSNSGGLLERQLEKNCVSPPGVAHLDWFGGPEEVRETGDLFKNQDFQNMGTVVVGRDASLPSWLQVREVAGIAMTPVCDCGRLIGRLFEDADASYCMLGGIVPSDLSVSRGEQTRDVFSTIHRALRQQGMEFRHVIRTSFYLDRILDWYGEFNHARSSFFEKIDLDLMPASTGVGAANSSGAALCAKVIAVLPKTPAVSVQKAVSPLQGEAAAYGSAFSRAVEMRDASSRTLYISGTASIAPDGRTLHVGDAASQIETTMEVVDAMLERCGMGIEDMTRGVVYLRDGADAPHWSRYCERRALGSLPVAVAQSDVCRDDLLFEIELDAAKQLQNA